MIKRFLSQKKYYLMFSMFFLAFGFIIALLTSIINYKANISNIDEKLFEWSKEESDIRRRLLVDYIRRSEQMLYSIVRSELTLQYLKYGEDENKRNLQKLFYTLAYSNKDIMQLRYIDSLGNEVIRIDRDKKSPELLVVPEEKLQNKSDRYYFKEGSLLMTNQFWHSNVDLNIEHGHIEQPIKPTFRVATPLVVENHFKGIIIVNLLFESTINVLTSSPSFHVYLLDKEGEIIHHPDHTESWSKYLANRQNMYDLFPETVHNILNNRNYYHRHIFSYFWGDVFRNTEGMKVVFVPKHQIVKNLRNQNLLAAVIVACTVLLVSIPLSWLISIIPSRLQNQLAEAYHEIKKKSDIIDKHVMVTTTNKQGVIQDVSTYFTKLTGYTPDEVIGRTHSLLKHPDTSGEIHTQLWKTILAGKVWSGELKDRHKNGKDFWLKKVITPDFDDQGGIVGFTAIAHDITDKKIIQQLSITDSLTGLFNRRRTDEVLSAEIARSNRYESIFSIILFDIDHFKKVNDTYGHQTGDDVLVQLADILKKNARETDCIGRWGGEEFLIIVREGDMDGTFIFADKVRKIIGNHKFPTVGQVTISCGVAQYANNETSSGFIARADAALYTAKKSGRNTVVKG